MSYNHFGANSYINTENYITMLYYYYDPKIKRGGTHYFTDYYCTNGRKKVWAGEISRDTQTEVLKSIRHIVNVLNMPKPFFGYDGILSRWIWFIKCVIKYKI